MAVAESASRMTESASRMLQCTRSTLGVGGSVQGALVAVLGLERWPAWWRAALLGCCSAPDSRPRFHLCTVLHG